MKPLELMAKDLVKCGYADSYHAVPIGNIQSYRIVYTTCDDITVNPYVEFSVDTLEGRRQLDALEDWLIKNQLKLWDRARYNVTQLQSYNSQHRERLDRIKWCYDQLVKDK